MKIISLVRNAAIALALCAIPAKAEVIKNGATPTGIPFNFLDKNTNTMRGFLLDLAAEVGKRGGFEFDLQTMDFQSLVPALQSNRIDIITSSFAITEKRAEVVDFAVPLYSFHCGLLVPAGNPKNLVTYEDLSKAKIGTNMGNSIIASARENGIELELYSTIQDLVRDLNMGRIDGAIIDMPIVDQMLKDNPDYKMQWVGDFKPFSLDFYSFAVRKGDKALLDRINPILTEIKKDGTLEALIKQWGISVGIAP
jgi:polar amino acid transport system substrate-binding protein